MSAQTYLTDALGRLANVEVYQTVAPSSVTLPAVIWIQDGSQVNQTMDGGNELTLYFEVECRTLTAAASVELSKEVKQELAGAQWTHTLGDYTEPYDASQGKLEYFSHILNIGISNA